MLEKFQLAVSEESFLIKGVISEQEIIKKAENLKKINKFGNRCHKSPSFIVIYSEERQFVCIKVLKDCYLVC